MNFSEKISRLVQSNLFVTTVLNVSFLLLLSFFSLFHHLPSVFTVQTPNKSALTYFSLLTSHISHLSSGYDFHFRSPIQRASLFCFIISNRFGGAETFGGESGGGNA